MTNDDSFKAPLVEASRRAIETMQDALAEGFWEPDPRRDPMTLISELDTMTRSSPVVVDISKAMDLASLSLAAMEAGDWSGVTESQISDIQRFNFLALLADEMAPTPAQISFIL